MPLVDCTIWTKTWDRVLDLAAENEKDPGAMLDIIVNEYYNKHDQPAPPPVKRSRFKRGS